MTALRPVRADPDLMLAYRCRLLWAAVLASCVAGVIHARHGGGRPESVYGSCDASWLRSRDFDMVCDLAGVDSDALASRIAGVWDDRDAARAFAAALLHRHERHDGRRA